MSAEELIVSIMEEREISRNEILRHVTYYNQKYAKDSSQKSLLALCACGLLQPDNPRTEQLFQTMSEQKPSQKSGLVWVLAALKSCREHNYRAAVNAFKISSGCNQALKKKQHLVHEKIIRCSILLRNYTEAIDYFTENQSVFTDEALPKILCSVAYCHEQKHDIRAAARIYRQIASTHSPFAGISGLWLRFLDRDLEGIEEAINALSSEFEESSQEWVDCKYLLAEYYLEGAQMDQAIKTLQLVSKCRNHQEYLLSLLGMAWMRVDNYKEAFLCYLKAASVNRYIPEIWFNLAVIYCRVGQNESEAAFETAKNLDVEGLIPIELTEKTQILRVNFNFSWFGHTRVQNNEIWIAPKSTTRNFIKPTTVKIEHVEKSNEIAVPMPVKCAQINGEVRKVENFLPFDNQNVFMYQNCLHFLNWYRDQIVKNEPGNVEGQAAQILINFEKLPCKRSREAKRNLS